MRLRLPASLLLAVSATLAHAQTSTYSLLQPNSTTTVVPVWNNSTRQIEALLLLEPSTSTPANPAVASVRTIAGYSRSLGDASKLYATFGIAPSKSVGLFCNGRSGLLTSLDALADHCQLGSSSFGIASPGLNAQVGVQRKNLRLTASAGVQQAELTRGAGLPTEFDPLGQGGVGTPGLGGRISQQDIGLNGTLTLGNQGWVNIGGTMAKARLIPASQISGTLPSEWNSSSLSVGGGRGNIGGEVVGRVVTIPGQAESYRSVGAGVTWRTPWRAKLSVGADNLMTRGKNPLSADGNSTNKLGTDASIDGAVPFVRYEQDL